MRKILLSLVSVAALAAISAPANAAVNVSYTAGNVLGNNQQVFENFGNTAVSVGGNSNIYVGDVSGKGKTPAGSTGGYLAVGSDGAGSFTLNLPAAAPVLSFLLGTLDDYNQVVINFVGAPSQTLIGSAITGGSATGTSFVDGRVTYDVGTSDPLAFISSIVFSSSQAAMEIDDVASAAPEPGTWLMMILGFGIVGAGLRSRRRQGKATLA